MPPAFRFKPIDELNEKDLQQLITDQVAEDQFIEYKQELPGGNDQQRREFLADVSSFANAAGGHVVYGMASSQGVASSLASLSGDPDAEVLRLESMMQTAITPRMPGARPITIRLAAGGFVIVVHVPRSFAQPHAVTFKGDQAFYSRGAAGKYRMDVSQLRSAFVKSDATSVRLRQFQRERLALVMSEETPMPLRSGPKVIAHLLPVAAMDGSVTLPLRDLQRDRTIIDHFQPDFAQFRYNADGFLAYGRPRDDEPALGYAQIFRSGALEVVNAPTAGGAGEPVGFYPVHLESWLVERFPRWLRIQAEIGAELPTVLLVALLQFKGAVGRSRNAFRDRLESVERDDVFLPEVFMEDAIPDLVVAQLRPVCDALWNAVGSPQSPNWTNDNHFEPRM